MGKQNVQAEKVYCGISIDFLTSVALGCRRLLKLKKKFVCLFVLLVINDNKTGVNLCN